METRAQQQTIDMKTLEDVDISKLPPDGGDEFNRLIFEASPYLLQHATNPVQWWPWGKDAFAEAHHLDKPVFLSIGYSTCHWCHVMAHESFADRQVADLLNRDFISIKVDREERPDVDAIYMLVCQMFSGQGGWPLTVVLTPDRQPLFAATYIPKQSRGGMVGLIDLLPRLSELWQKERSRLTDSGEQITQAIRNFMQSSQESRPLQPTALRNALFSFQQNRDTRWGGFGSAPKFPTPHNLSLLLRLGQRGHAEATATACQTLQAIRHGGIYDQVGFGLHRYSVDERWLVPHFEKMLYDQALFSLAAIEAFQATGEEHYARMATDTLEYVLRDLRHPQGGFFCGEDADSEGHEGTFYLWTPEQATEVLGSEQAQFTCDVLNITKQGQFENKSIPHFRKNPSTTARESNLGLDGWQAQLEDNRKKLFEARSKRIRPHLDDKVITAWNGLTITALARTGQVLKDSQLLIAAEQAADFLLQNLRSDEGRLLRRWRHGEAAIPGFLEDYAFVIWGLLELFQATSDPQRLKTALDLATEMDDLFRDNEGGYFDSGRDAETVLVRSKSIQDGACPAGSSVAALVLLHLGRLTGDEHWQQKAEKLLGRLLAQAEDSPMAFGQLLIALDEMLRPILEITLIPDKKGNFPAELERPLRQSLLPGALILRHGQDKPELAALVPALRDCQPGSEPIVQICIDHACQPPATDIDQLQILLQQIAAQQTPIE